MIFGNFVKYLDELTDQEIIMLKHIVDEKYDEAYARVESKQMTKPK